MKAFRNTRLLVLPLLVFGTAGSACLLGSEDEQKAEAKTISLDSIYSTSYQKPFKTVTAGFNLRPGGAKEYTESYGHLLEQLKREFRGGASNVFLVRGDNIDEAITATCWVYTLGVPVAEPVS